MDKKAIIGIALCLLVLILYPFYINKIFPQKQQEEKASIAQKAEPSYAEKAVPVEEIAAEIKSTPDYKEEEFFIQTDLYNIVLSNYGGTIKRLQLKKYKDKDDKEHDLALERDIPVKPLALTNVGPLGDLSKALFTGRIEGKKVVFEHVTEDKISIKKIFYFDENEYIFKVRIVFKNSSNSGLGINSYQMVYGTIFPIVKKTGISELGLTVLEQSGTVLREKVKKIKEKTETRGPCEWAGMQNQYYALIAKPETLIQDVVTVPLYGDNKKKVEGLSSSIRMEGFSLAPGGVHEEEFVFFMGPKEYSLMKKAPYKFGKILYFGWFGFISEWILIGLNFFYKLFHNYGIAIIVITLIIKLVMYPLTAKSMKSMKQMQAIQPLVNEIRANNKDNPKKMQKEMMMVYKEYKVNPMSGCLPMLAQLPIFIALFTTLRGAIELKGASFLWIHDLSVPDTVFSIGAIPVNILPLIMGVTMVWQQKLTPVADPNQAKMMMLMPVVFTFLFYNFPSGLVLYWLVNNILSIWQQYKITKSA